VTTATIAGLPLRKVTEHPPFFNMLVYGESGVGKGHPHGTSILTPNGFKKIEDFIIGDPVIDANGNITSITGIYPRGLLKVFEVVFSDGSNVLVDEEHLWISRTNNHQARNQPWLVIDTAYIRSTLHRKWRIPIVESIKFNKRDLPINPYVMGVLLGDGSFVGSSIRLSTDIKTSNIVRKLLPKSVCMTPVGFDDIRSPQWFLTTERGQNNPLLNAISNYGLHGLHSYNKFIPEDYLFSSIEDRTLLLQGLMDTDGELTIRPNNIGSSISYSTSSARFADDIEFLIQSLGGIAYKTIRKEPKYFYNGELRTGRPSHRICLCLPENIYPFMSRKGYIAPTKYLPNRIVREINPAGEKEVVCISVDSPTKTYVTEHCIVTHNTTLAGSADEVPEMRKVLIIDIEGGTLSIRKKFPNVEVVRVKNWSDLSLVYDELYAGLHDFSTIVIDSLTECQKMCYASDTEVLTPNGWKLISELAEGVDLIAQYEIGTELISFVQPLKIFKYHHDGEMISIQTKSSGLLITPNHRVLTNTYSGKFLKVRRADELKSGLKLPTSGTLQSTGGPTPEQARLLVAWAADGHKNYNGMKFHIKKQEKIDRLKKLIVDCGLSYRTPDWNDEGTYILVDNPWPIMKFMPNRMWKVEHIFWSTDARDAIMSEMPYWDSTPQPSGSGSFCYRTSYRENADAISAIATVTGWSNSISIDETRTTIYRVNLVRATWRKLTTYKTEQYNGDVWCVAVPSGFIVTRRNDKVTICGNSMDAVMKKLVNQYEDRDPDVPGIREWNINIEQTRKFVRLFRDLPMNTIFTTLCKTDKNMNTGAIRRKPSLSGKVADEVAGFLDIVTYLYTKEEPSNPGSYIRVLLCGNTESEVAKDRTDLLPLTIPNPTMNVIWKAVKGLKTNEQPA